jgi:hypothetical protein
MIQNLSRLKFPLYRVELGQKPYSLRVKGILVILQNWAEFQIQGSNSYIGVPITVIGSQLVQMTQDKP